VPSVNVFAYGSLMFEPVWAKVCADVYRTEPGTLEGYSRYCVRDETYPAVIAEPNGKVEGVIYLDVSPLDQERLDRFEGSEYKLQRAHIGAREVVFYEFVRLDQIEKAPWNPEHFALHGLPLFLATHVGSFLESGSRDLAR
jgi:gamma-glutamylcyclotransferase (GGCT)/AIG2-like uncharacterized protein YtfP